MVDTIDKAASKIMRVSSKVKHAIVSMKSGTIKDRRRKNPSKETIELIKQIHAGFDPICLSAKRWALEEKLEKEKREETLEDLIEGLGKENEKYHTVLKEKKNMVHIKFNVSEEKFLYEVPENMEDLEKRIAKVKEMEQEKEK